MDDYQEELYFNHVTLESGEAATLLLCLYVDDLLAAGPKQALVAELEAPLQPRRIRSVGTSTWW